MKVFPNPATNSIAIKFQLTVQDSFTIFLVDSKGQKIALIREGSSQGKNSFSFSAKGFPQGAYYVVMERKKICKFVSKVMISKN